MHTVRRITAIKMVLQVGSDHRVNTELYEYIDRLLDHHPSIGEENEK